MTPLILALLVQTATPTPTPSPTPSPTPTPAVGLGSLPVCLARPFTDATGAARSVTAVVRPGTVASLVKSGFSVVLCSSVKQSATQYRDAMCKLASSGNSAKQARLTSILGAPPRLLCSEATELGSLLPSVLPSGN